MKINSISRPRLAAEPSATNFDCFHPATDASRQPTATYFQDNRVQYSPMALLDGPGDVLDRVQSAHNSYHFRPLRTLVSLTQRHRQLFNRSGLRRLQCALS